MTEILAASASAREHFLAAILVHHDSCHIGQLAFLRKHLGYGAMAYPPREEA